MKKHPLLWTIIVIGLFIPIQNKWHVIPQETITTVRSEIRPYWTQATEWVSSLGHSSQETKRTDSKVSQRTVTNNQATASSGQTDQTAKNQTPVYSFMGHKTAPTTYYYHFQENVPQSVRQVFNYAIKTYNATGLVRLVAGKGNALQNQVTFYVFDRTSASQTHGMIELGNGGPKVFGWSRITVNHGRAGLNLAYPQAIRRSVALHELGHALGLDHSQSRTSVMYPIDQGRLSLSQADINGLKTIYK